MEKTSAIFGIMNFLLVVNYIEFLSLMDVSMGDYEQESQKLSH